MSRGDLLFHKYELLATLENNLNKTRAAVRSLPANTFENESDDATLDRLTHEHSLAPVELRENDLRKTSPAELAKLIQQKLSE
jgi:hypothetical protein